MAIRLPLLILAALLLANGVLSQSVASAAIGVISLIAALSVQRAYSTAQSLALQ